MDSSNAGGDFQLRLVNYQRFREHTEQGRLAELAAAAEQSRRRRRRVILASACAVLVLLVGTCLAARLSIWPERQARAAVLAYFDALAAEFPRWGAVEPMVAPEAIDRLPQVEFSDGSTGPAVQRQLLPSGRLPGRTCLPPQADGTRHSRGPFTGGVGCYAPPDHVDVVDVTVAGGTAVVAIEFGFDDDDGRYPATLELRQEQGTMSSALARWQILDAFGTFTLSGASGGWLSQTCEPPASAPLTTCVTLDGLPIADMAGTTRTPSALPGRHQIEVHVGGVDGNRWRWQSTTSTVVVLPGAEVEVVLGQVAGVDTVR